MMDYDIRQNYKTKIPDILNRNKFMVKDAVFQKYRQKLINQKRNLELELLGQNKKHDVTHAIVEIVDKYQIAKDKAEKRSQTVFSNYNAYKKRTKHNLLI